MRVASLRKGRGKAGVRAWQVEPAQNLARRYGPVFSGLLGAWPPTNLNLGVDTVLSRSSHTPL